ncbi:unnamed protein product [Rotaria sordida]|uniref:TRPM SLOG domain-containing protein n=1 Tax=Rotaria sordida TaxID=392033 RepID=A0A819L7I5_9BILA|nr:unnamed protein product [Rotaria sordida]
MRRLNKVDWKNSKRIARRTAYKMSGPNDNNELYKEDIVVISFNANDPELDHETLQTINNQVTVHSEKEACLEHQSNSMNLNKDSAIFLWFQLLKDAILKLRPQPLPDAVNDMDYENQQNQSQKVLNLAIRWYTKASFVYKMINKAMRTEDINQLYTFRFYIADLCENIARLHEEQNNGKSNVEFYRGLRETPNIAKASLIMHEIGDNYICGDMDAWILTAGLNSGVAQLVGEAFFQYQILTENYKPLTIIGLTKWGSITKEMRSRSDTSRYG